MRIFFFESCFDGTVGGSHSCMYNLTKNMESSDFIFTVGFYADNPYVDKFHDLGIETKILPRDPVRRGNIFLRKARNWYRLEYGFRKYLEDYFRSKKFDLIVLNNSAKLGLPFIRVSKNIRIPIVAYERGLATIYKRKHMKATEDLQASIAISDAVKDNLLKYKFRSPIIQRIYDGVNPSSFLVKRSPSEIKTDFNIPTKSRVIGIIGNVKPWKGHKYFIEAFLQLAHRYEDLYGLVVGDWTTEDQKFQIDLQQTVHRAGFDDRVMFLGYQKDIPELLSIFDVFVHASTKPEPFGMVILEAMAAQKPVIATDNGGPLEILKNRECGILVPPENAKAIAEACKQYLDDQEFRNKIINKAYRRLVSDFHIAQTVEKTSTLFKKIVTESRN